MNAYTFKVVTTITLMQHKMVLLRVLVGHAQESGEEADDSARNGVPGLLADVAEEAVRTDKWWEQLGDRSIEDQLLSDLRKNGNQHFAIPLYTAAFRTQRMTPAQGRFALAPKPVSV